MLNFGTYHTIYPRDQRQISHQSVTEARKLKNIGIVLMQGMPVPFILRTIRSTYYTTYVVGIATILYIPLSLFFTCLASKLWVGVGLSFWGRLVS